LFPRVDLLALVEGHEWPIGVGEDEAERVERPRRGRRRRAGITQVEQEAPGFQEQSGLFLELPAYGVQDRLALLYAPGGEAVDPLRMESFRVEEDSSRPGQDEDDLRAPVRTDRIHARAPLPRRHRPGEPPDRSAVRFLRFLDSDQFGRMEELLVARWHTGVLAARIRWSLPTTSAPIPCVR